MKDSSEWKLKPQIFWSTLQYRETPDIDLFAPWVFLQLPCYIFWKLDPFNKGRKAFQSSWKYQQGHAFLPFSLIGRVLSKVQTDQVQILLVTPTMQSQSWHPRPLQMSVDKPILISQVEDLLMSPEMEKNPLIEKRKLRFLAWIVLRIRSWLLKQLCL